MLTLPNNLRLLGCIVALGISTAVSPIAADVICYPDMAGDDVAFENIVESSLETGALFGSPSVSGNQISFPATGFVVQTINNDIDFINGRLDMTIRAEPGKLIDSLTFEEFGSYFLQGPDAMAISSAVAMLTADGNNLFGNMMFDVSTAGSNAWMDSMTIHFAPTDEVRLVYDSRLFAATADGSVAFIDKGGINISVGTISAVPEPAAGLLLGGSLLIGLCFKRRR